MKKIILSCAALAFAAVTMVSCGENKDAAKETAATETEKPAETPATPAPEAPAANAPAAETPSFSNEDVNKGLAEYKTLIADYVAALKNKDQAKVSELAAKAQKVNANMPEWMKKLKPEETQKFTEYFQQLGKEWAEAAKAAM